MDYSVKCFICEENLIGAKEVATVKERGCCTLRDHSLKIGDKKHKILKGKTEIKIHQKCRTTYFLSKKVIPGSSSSPVSEKSTPSVSGDFEFNKLCFICQKDYYSRIRRKHVVHSDELKEKLLDVAKLRNDPQGKQVTDLITRVKSLSEVKARYHNQCLVYFKRFPTDPSDVEDSPLEKSLKFVFDYIENNVEGRTQFTVSNLIDVMEYKPSPRTLIKHLENYFGNEIKITGRGLKSKVTYCGTSDLPAGDMWYTHSEQRKEDEHIRIIRTAAELIRKQIKSTEFKTKTNLTSVSVHENVHAEIPKYLDSFLEELIMFDVHEKKTNPTDAADDPERQDYDDAETINEIDNENLTSLGVKKEYIAHSIIAAIRPKSFISTLVKNPCFTQYGQDSADHNPCTIDGKNTMHININEPSSSLALPLKKRKNFVYKE